MEFSNLTARDPVILGLCSQLILKKQLEKLIEEKKRKKLKKKREKKLKEKRKNKNKQKSQMKINKNPTVGIIMGSKSDWKGVMEHCVRF